MKIQTTRFGEVEIQEGEILPLPNGMLGFTSDQHFAMLEDEIGSPFQWMQSLDNPELAFVTIDPDFAISDYRIEVSADHLKKLSSAGSALSYLAAKGTATGFAALVSALPTMVKAAELATASATPLVPPEKASISKTPIGPFQNTVLAPAMASE